MTKDLTNKQTNQSEAKLNSSFSHDETGVDKAKSSTSPNSRAAVDWKELFISSKDIHYKTYHWKEMFMSPNYKAYHKKEVFI